MLPLILTVMFFFHLNPDDDFKQELEEYLGRNLSGYDKFEYEIVSPVLNPLKGKISIIKDAPLLIKGDLAYLQVSQSTLKTILTLRLKLYKNLYSCIRRIKKDDPISDNDFIFSEIDVTQVKGTPFTFFDHLNEFTAKVSIAPGTILIEELLKKKPVILAGNKIEAVVEKGNVLISAEAISRQNGAKGDIIKIEVPGSGSRKLLKAKVDDLNKVTIIE